MANFSSVDDNSIIYGSCAPDKAKDNQWIDIAKAHKVEKVICLRKEFCDSDFYAKSNLELYHVPIEDYHLPTPSQLQIILQQLVESEKNGQATVVHCAGGKGRTGFVLTCWYYCMNKGKNPNLTVEEAADAVKANAKKQGAVRIPFEAEESKHITSGQSKTLIEEVYNNWWIPTYK